MFLATQEYSNSKVFSIHSSHNVVIFFLLFGYCLMAATRNANGTVVFPGATKAKAKVAAAVKSESASAKPKIKIDDEKKVDAIKGNAMKMVSTCGWFSVFIPECSGIRLVDRCHLQRTPLPV